MIQILSQFALSYGPFKIEELRYVNDLKRAILWMIF